MIAISWIHLMVPNYTGMTQDTNDQTLMFSPEIGAKGGMDQSRYQTKKNYDYKIGDQSCPQSLPSNL